MIPLALVITDAGRAALVDAEAGGTNAVRIIQVGLSVADFVDAPTLTALPGEFKRLSTISGQAIDAETVHLTIRDSSADAYFVRGLGLYLEDGTLFAVYSQPAVILQKAEVSTFLLAADLKFLPGEAELIEFGDANFLNPPASEEVMGVAYLATIAEALAGAVADKIITPATMKAVLDNYVAAAELGAPNGVATLGPDGKLLLAQRPPVDLVDVFPAANEAAMLALAATPGDFAVRADNGLVYVLQAAPATLLANWLEISTPAPVSSVNGKVGTVVLNAGDVGAVPTARSVTGAGLLAGQGGALTADRIFTLLAASAAEALAGAIGDKVLTPASLADILAAIAGKASGGATINVSGGVLGGGGAIGGNPTIELIAANLADLASGRWDRAVTPGSLALMPKSLTPNGYVTLPGGFMIQWVRFRQLITTETTFNIAFPTSFPNAALPVSLTGFNASYSTVRDLWPQLYGEPTVNGCVVQTQSDDGKDMRLDGFDLIVMGF